MAENNRARDSLPVFASTPSGGNSSVGGKVSGVHPPLIRMRLREKDAKSNFMDFHYNPSDIGMSKGLNFEEDDVPGMKVSRPQFKSGKARKFTFQMFLNDYGEKSFRSAPQRNGQAKTVEEVIFWLEQVSVPTSQSTVSKYKGEPPRLEWIWREVMVCYITSLSVNRTMFYHDTFDACRATVDLELTEYLDHPGSDGGFQWKWL